MNNIYYYQCLLFNDNFMKANELNEINNQPYFTYFFDINKVVKEFNENINLNVGEEKIKLYNSYQDTNFVKKMQHDIFLNNILSNLFD